MEAHFDQKTQRLTVRLTYGEGEALLEGKSFSGMAESGPVVVQPLSDINPDSRPTEPKDGARLKKQLGELTCQATVMNSQTIIYVAESLIQNRAHVAAEQIDYPDISGNTKLRPKAGIRIELD
ncbi:hypothetical protein EPN95_03645 [Patescibacteria group bacterium]|nr:MAG: hypothetical protein EPN95_03645 [Patescibacteria group bacterium]